VLVHENLRIDYLATFDSGNASIRWPQKDAARANEDQKMADAEFRRAIITNLLVKPFVSLRHTELFDNLALAKFVSRHHLILKRMCEAGLVRICSQIAAPWEEICSNWAIRNPQKPMHWHHLTPERQRSYDLASRNGQISDLRSMEACLWLHEHKDARGHTLNLDNLVKIYDEIFPEHRIIVTSHAQSPD